MNTRIAFLTISISLFSTLASGGVFLTGTVQDAKSRDPIPAANVRLLGTSQGTITNADGIFRLNLQPGSHSIVLSSVGYRPDTLNLVLSTDISRNFLLIPHDIVMPEVVVTSEDPAIEIIRRAIANKRRWIDQLVTYEMDAFTRQIFKKDTSIASINESFTKGYWQQGDTLREIIKQRRQTENIKANFNFASVGRILNFNDDDIKFVGYTFVGPTAYNALDYYDYKLLRTRSSDRQDIYEIKMIPRSRTVPLFDGTISIADGSYALMGVDVVPNEAFLLPFVKESRLRYRQQFGLYEKTFWMPVDIRIDASISIGVIGFSFPKIGFSQTSVISDYRLNTVIPDSIFKKPRLVVDSTSVAFDSTHWVTHDLLPLTAEEKIAYETLDSTKTLAVQFRPGGFAISIGVGSESEGAVNAIDYLDASFNRVEGFHLGLKAELDKISPFLKLSAGFAYGFSDKTAKSNIGATVFTTEKQKLGIGGEAYRRLARTPTDGFYGTLINSLTSFFNKNDYEDYYRADGWRAFIIGKPLDNLKIETSFTSEWQTRAEQHSDFSILSRSRSYRANSLITEGLLRSTGLTVRYGKKPVPLDLVAADWIELSVENSSPSIAASHFDFTRYRISGSASIRTFGRSHLLAPSLRLRASAGTSTGSLPPQRVFSLESSSSGYGPFGVMRALNVKEFSGLGFVALNVEHNFRTLPFLALGIPFLYENQIEFLLHGGAARTWSKVSLALNTTDGAYSEAGFGFSRLFGILRADFTWRLSEPGGFRFTIGAANIF